MILTYSWIICQYINKYKIFIYKIDEKKNREKIEWKKTADDYWVNISGLRDYYVFLEEKHAYTLTKKKYIYVPYIFISFFYSKSSMINIWPVIYFMHR